MFTLLLLSFGALLNAQLLYINIDPAPCTGNIAINNAIAQSFTFDLGSGTYNLNFSIWIKPELYYVTTYKIELYSGDGTSGALIATSAELSMRSSTDGTPATFYDFAVPAVKLTDVKYTWKLVRVSTYSGAFTSCGNVYNGGNGYWLGYSSETGRDYVFKLYVTPNFNSLFPTQFTSGVSITNSSCASETDRVAINNAIGQSFKWSDENGNYDVKLSIWIQPELYYVTSYNAEIYLGEGTSGSLIATSSNTVSMNSRTNGDPSKYYDFFFDVTLKKSTQFTWKLVRKSTYSGAFWKCKDVDPNGKGYWLGYSASPSEDYAYGITAVPAWRCIPDTYAPVRYANGIIECMSFDGVGCLWGSNTAECIAALQNPKPKIIPLTCGPNHFVLYGVTGFETSNHWCNKTYTYFNKLIV